MPLRLLFPALLLLPAPGCSPARKAPAGRGAGVAQDPPPGPDVAEQPDVRDAASDAGKPGGDGGDGGDADAGPPSDTGPEDDARQPCRIHSDCPEGQVCIADRCGPECREDRDCEEPGEVCHHNLCQGPGAPCAAPEDCLPGEICDRGTCRGEPECIFAEDCGADRDCVNGECRARDPAEGEGEGECAPYGGVCSGMADCCTELCLDVPPPLDDVGVCTDHCFADAECPGLDVCYPVGDHRVCVANDVGDACRAPVECNFGLCINEAGGMQAFCSVACTNRDRCGQTRGCGRVFTGDGQPLWACVPVGAVCTRASQCTTNRCLPDHVGAATGYCTNDCRGDGDCAFASACCPIPDPEGVLVNVCVRGGCPQQ